MKKLNEIAPGYLEANDIVDYRHPQVMRRAELLAKGAQDTFELARRCYEFVRDDIAHSFDIAAKGPVSCTASEVLQNGHGICYAQSHLLAALLRANGIPAGFDYQRLYDDDLNYCLHGFNTVWLPEIGWYRLDARGNTGDIDARFCPPQEKLAFTSHAPGEIDYRLNLAIPLTCVVRALRNAGCVDDLQSTLPSSVSMG